MATTKVVGSIEHSERVRDKDSVVIHENWTIPTFKQLFLNDNTITEIHSPTFTETPSTHYKFQLKVQVHRRNTGGLFDYQYNNEIHIIYKSSTRVFLESIRLIASGDRLMIPCDTTIWPCSIVDANKWQGFIGLWGVGATTTTMNQVTGWGAPVQGLQLNFEFVVSNKRLTEENLSQIAATQRFKAELSNDFENLLQTGMYTDTVMKSAEDEEFPVHKAVLASRSAVLKAHFEHNTTETITNIVKSHLEASVLREVLFFIYTDKAPKVDEIPGKLLAGADFYQLNRLRSLCEEALHKKLTVENAIETLQLADLHSVNNLKKKALEFIKKDLEKSKLITKTEGWAKLQSVDLFKQMYE